jgi:ADP-ribose pyrophosphatase
VERTYTHPDVAAIGVAEGWAEPETDPARIDWPPRQASAAITFGVVDGRPVNPCEQTGIRYGRNEMGFWGENLMADALVTCSNIGGTIRWLLMIERDDGRGYAVPGGHVEPGESPVQAAVRELAEETGLEVHVSAAEASEPRYVPDPRASDEAWAVTVPVRIDLGRCGPLPEVRPGDDARRAGWAPATSYAELTAYLGTLCGGGRVFAAHTDMLRDFLDGPR